METNPQEKHNTGLRALASRKRLRHAGTLLTLGVFQEPRNHSPRRDWVWMRGAAFQAAMTAFEPLNVVRDHATQGRNRWRKNVQVPRQALV